MKLVINGRTGESSAATLTELLQELDLAGRRVAAEVNGEIVPRSEHASFRLTEGDRIEIVHAIGGG